MAVVIRNTWLIDDHACLHHGDVLLADDGSWQPTGSGTAALEHIDGSALLVTRSLQNWHTHLAMTLLRSHGEGLPLMQWLNNAVFPMEAKLDAQAVSVGTLAAAAELIRTGCSFACDMYFFPEAIAQALVRSGIRGIITAAIVDFPTPSYPQGSSQGLDQIESLLRGPGTGSPLVQYGIGMQSIYTCATATLQRAAVMARKYDAPLNIHVCETEVEVRNSVAEHGLAPVQYLESIGFFKSGTIAAHCGWLAETDTAIFREHDVLAVGCPTSNMKLATGATLAIDDLQQAGVRVALGTDGAASNNSLDMRAEAKQASLLQRQVHHDSTRVPPQQAWKLATHGSQDWVTWDLSDPRMAPFGTDGRRLLGNLVYSHADCVDMWVAGRAIRRNGITLTIDEAAVCAELDTLGSALETATAATNNLG